MKILLVEDDQPTAAVLSELLTTQYYTVDVATDGITGLELATAWDYELILLDLLIPKLDGISLCRQLRAQGYQKPILLLTIKGTSTDIVRGLDAGADDYVTKPYDLSELLARIRAMLRRGDTQLAPALLVWENLCVNPISAEVTYAGQLLNLTPKEYGLLGLFLRSPQRVFSRSDIIDRLWSIDACPSEGAVTNLIKDLRQKLKSSGMTTDLLETVYGLGYRLKPAPLPQPIGEQIPKAKRPRDLTAINKVLERYQNTFAARVELLEQAEQALRGSTLSQSLQQTAAEEAHRLAGTLGSFGYEQGSKAAQAIEHLLLSELTQSDLPRLTVLVADLKQELTQPPKPYTAQQFETAPVPVVLMIDPDLPFTAQLQADAFAWGFRIEAAADLASAQARLETSVNVIVLNLQNSAANRLELLETLKQQFSTLPILVITDQPDLSDRVAMARLGIRQFLSQPITTAELFAAVAQVLPKPQSAEAKVLVLDDDPLMLVKISSLLRPWGLQVQTLQDPQQFWTLLVSTQPDLLIMDLEMPTFSGIDLCRVVRQDLKWGNLPILVVTARTDFNSVQQVFAAGADDFISKPIAGPELVTRVISRIDRSRLQQELETMKRRIGI